jgi:spermidine synthase
VLLLRLRQICSHATLLAEDGDAYVQSHEADEDFIIEFANELTRARRLVSEEFVTKMKEKFKREALARMEAEKAVCCFFML